MIIFKSTLTWGLFFFKNLIAFITENRALQTYSILGLSNILFLFWFHISTFVLVLKIINNEVTFLVSLTSPKGKTIDFFIVDKFSLSFFSSFLYPFAMIVLLFSAYRSFLSSFDGDLKWKGRSTPSVGLRKLYSIIFAPFFFINWILKKIR